MGDTGTDNPEWVAHMRALYPAPISADLPSIVAICERRVIHLPDLEHNPSAVPATLRASKAAAS